MSVISEDDMAEVVEGVWMTILEQPVLPGVQSDLNGHEFVMADIEISGAWVGSVHVKASEAFLTSAAAHIFCKDASEVEPVDREDSITELTNIIGGTIKVLLPEGSDLSLPEIINDSFLSEDQDWFYFTCGGYPLAVAVEEDTLGNRHVA